MARTNININETLIRKAQKLTRLKTKREIVDRALQLLVRSENRKSILHYHGSGIWKGELQVGSEKSGLILVDTSVGVDFFSPRRVALELSCAG
jgi:hypothetical protein